MANNAKSIEAYCEIARIAGLLAALEGKLPLCDPNRVSTIHEEIKNCQLRMVEIMKELEIIA